MSAHVYPHMCRDGHEEVGWRGEGEMCPVCVVTSDALELREALEAFLESYLRGVSSGDWGNWNPEDEPEVIAVRAALQKAEGR